MKDQWDTPSRRGFFPHSESYQILELNCDLEKLDRWDCYGGCETESFSTLYLGLPLEHNPRNLSTLILKSTGG